MSISALLNLAHIINVILLHEVGTTLDLIAYKSDTAFICRISSESNV